MGYFVFIYCFFVVVVVEFEGFFVFYVEFWCNVFMVVDVVWVWVFEDFCYFVGYFDVEFFDYFVVFYDVYSCYWGYEGYFVYFFFV